MKRKRTTLRLVDPDQVPVAWTPRPGLAERAAQAALDLIEAARQHPKALDEVVLTLGKGLRMDFAYSFKRQDAGTYTPYDEHLAELMEAMASAIVLLQAQQAQPAPPAPTGPDPDLNTII